MLTSFPVHQVVFLALSAIVAIGICFGKYMTSCRKYGGRGIQDSVEDVSVAAV
jgi:hypothetical protein